MNIIFEIKGGIGKCVAATAVCAAIKRQYPLSDLIVISGYPEVFFNNPNVSKNFRFGETPYFYKEFIENKEVMICKQEPYDHTDFIKRTKHLIEIWCEIIGVDYGGEQPEIHMTKRERTSLLEGVNSDKPILLMQTNGGADQSKKYSWARDLPVSVVNDVIAEFKATHNIWHIKREDQISYPNTLPISTDFRKICALASLSEKRLVIDSFLQHTLAALGLPAVNCWIANSPKVFGYEIHEHIIAESETVVPDLKHSMYFKFDWGGVDIEFPYEDETQIFDSSKIINALKTKKD